MEETIKQRFFLLGVLFSSIYTLLIKILPMIIDQFVKITSTKLVLIGYGTSYLLLFLITLYLLMFYFIRNVEIYDIIIFFIILILLFYVQFWLQKSEKLMIVNFDLSRTLKIELLSVDAYLSNFFKLMFFISLFFMALKKK